MIWDTLYDDIEAEVDRLERIALGEMHDDDDWHDIDAELDA